MKNGMKPRWSLLAILLVAALLPLTSLAQKIAYSEPEREDNRRTNFEIIGKVGANILVFKNNRSENAISVYDNDMKLINRVKLDYMDDRWINVDFVPYTDHAWMIYQFQRKNTVYCMAVKLNEEAKRLTDPIELDTTRIGWSANNKIYTTVFSDDKQQIMVFKINSRNQRNFLFTTMLYDAELKLKQRHNFNLPMEERNDYLTDFLVDNEGDLVFGKFRRKNSSDYVTDLHMLVKKSDQENLADHRLNGEEKILLDEVKIKLDNTNRRFLFTALYYKQKRGNIEGLYTAVWDKATDSLLRENTMVFSEELRKQAKGSDANLRIAFNDYFIKNIIIKKDGGYILAAESMYTTSRGGAFNRWDYMGWGNPWAYPMDYYSWNYYNAPWSSPWNRYGNRWGGMQSTRYFAENIMVLSFDKDGQMVWNNVIPKSQYDDDTDDLISNYIMNTGGQLHFLFNVYERRTLILNDQSVDADGKITRHPTLKGLDKGADFMPRMGKQISSRSMIMPCVYRNYITFAKIDF
ncbi:hypothetical protein HHL16_07810 [Pseudoflavitalea sp. G-6-1-2]|uniref:hypothetical protein n=1 Tax=Pseudoflavitalea sp. G-6-1-2 TaxID=2728841 RepID=UPI00146BD2A9|nr:hypothetical protein [Pseudoflavitalea sp. G-6-1-2]NML20775.1 hypothetical protein [Pseudoflavitalea sp. G-6-1-2]